MRFVSFLQLSFILFSTQVFYASSFTPQGSWKVTAYAPSPRAKHGVLCDPANQAVMVLAGRLRSGTNLNDFWVLNVTDGTWASVYVGGSFLPPRQAFSWVLHAGWMYVWGGQGDATFDDMWRRPNRDGGAWSSVSQGSTLPLARRRHGTLHFPLYNQFFVLFGQAPDRFLNDVWSFNFTSSQWTEIVFGGSTALPGVRFDTTCVVYDSSKGVCFGGTGTSSDYNDLWLLNILPTPTWTEIRPAAGSAMVSERRLAVAYVGTTTTTKEKYLTLGMGYQSSNAGNLNDVWTFWFSNATWQLRSQVPGSALPEIRDSSNLCMYNNIPYVVAGWGFTAFHNDIWTLNENGQWISIQKDIQVPPVRTRHAMVSLGESLYVAFGRAESILSDVWTFSTKTQSWAEVKTVNANQYVPAARYGMTCIVRSRSLVFYGGWISTTTSELFSLDIGNGNSWRPMVPSSNTLPPPRYTHAASYYELNDAMIVFGGQDSGNNVLSDLWSFSFAKNQWTVIGYNTTAGPGGRGAFGMTLLSSTDVTASYLVGGGYALVNGIYLDRWILRLTRNSDKTVVANWTQIANPIQQGLTERNFRRCEFAMCGSGSRLYFAGGGLSTSSAPSQNDSFYMYDPYQGNIRLTPLPQQVYFASCAFVGRSLYVFGGNVVINGVKVNTLYSSIMQQYVLPPSSMCTSPDTPDVECQACPIGSTPSATTGGCDLCPKGTYHDVSVQTCVPCGPGKYSNTLGATSELMCLPCPPGTYQPESGQTSCVKCPDTSVCPLGSQSAQDPTNSTSTLLSITTQQPPPYQQHNIPSEVYVTLIIICVAAVIIMMLMFVGVRIYRSKRLKRYTPEMYLRLQHLYEKHGGTYDGIGESGLFLLFRDLGVKNLSEKAIVDLLILYDDYGTRTIYFHVVLQMLIDLEDETCTVDQTMRGSSYSLPVGIEQLSWTIREQLPKRFSFKWVDMYKDNHTSGSLGQPIFLKQNEVGGTIACLYFLGCAAFVTVLVSQFLWQNVEELRSSLPKVAVDDTFKTNMQVDFMFLQGSTDRTTCVLPNGRCPPEITLTTTEILGADRASFKCAPISVDSCRMTWTCPDCTLGELSTKPMISIRQRDERMFAQNISVRVSTTTGIFDDSNSIQSSFTGKAFTASKGMVFRGDSPFVVGVEATPTFFRLYGKSGELTKTSGYHVRVTSFSTGSSVSDLSFHDVIGLAVDVVVDVAVETTLVVTRRELSSYVSLLSAILGAVSGLSSFATIIVKRWDIVVISARRIISRRSLAKYGDTDLQNNLSFSPKGKRSHAHYLALVDEDNVTTLLQSGLSFRTARDVLAIIHLVVDTYTRQKPPNPFTSFGNVERTTTATFEDIPKVDEVQGEGDTPSPVPLRQWKPGVSVMDPSGRLDPSGRPAFISYGDMKPMLNPFSGLDRRGGSGEEAGGGNVDDLRSLPGS